MNKSIIFLCFTNCLHFKNDMISLIFNRVTYMFPKLKGVCETKKISC